MNHKLNSFFKILALAGALVAAGTAGAQTPMAAPGTGASYGLLGQNYDGVAYTYTHHVSGLPNELNTYSFMANDAYAPGMDIGLDFAWQTGNQLGFNFRQSTLNVPFTVYKYAAWGRPLLEVDLGWMWQRNTGSKINGFRYGAEAGVELQLRPNLSLRPTLGYHEARRQNIRAWDAGAEAALRITQDWSGTLGVRMDEHDNISYTLGANMHY